MKRKNLLRIGLLFLIGHFTVATTMATNTAYTRAGKAYMGWHSSHAQIDGLGANISEQFLRNQTDWMASNFLSYGYNWICLDGWIGSGTRHNADGYVTTFNDSWVGGWTEMANYVQSKGMKFAMYYNPGWVLKSIADDTNNKIIGTGYTIKSITVPGKEYEAFYYIDVTKPGAEQYVKGMVNYFKSCNVEHLKVDFMKDYEDAYGHNPAMTLLRYIREAAGDNFIITISLPGGADHMREEKSYGDNIRTSVDYGNNGWYSTSEREKYYTNSVYFVHTYNSYAGASHFSDITGKDKIFNSPDYYTYSDNASDDEKKFATSLRFISGACVEFGDNYMDIGGVENANYLRNSELTALNADGFKGVPLTSDLYDFRNQIWHGTTSNGDRVVALFNREGYERSISVNYQTDLGLSGSHNIRDLWTHQNLGYLSSYTANVPAHGVVVLRIYVGNTPPANGDPSTPGALVPISGLSLNGRFVIINKNSGLTLSVLNGSTTNDVLAQYKYDGSLTQQWNIVSNGDSTCTITNANSGRSIDLYSGAVTDGAPVGVWDYHGGITQRWQILNTTEGYSKILSYYTAKGLLVEGLSKDDGAKVVQFTYNGGTNGEWQILNVNDISVVHMRKANSLGFAIDAVNPKVILYDQDINNDNQKWLQINRGGGFYSFQRLNTSLSIDGGNGGVAGQGIVLWATNSTNQNQHWKKIDTGSGTFRLQKRNASKFCINGGTGGANNRQLTLAGNSTTSLNQRWAFTTVTVFILASKISPIIDVLENEISTSLSIHSSSVKNDLFIQGLSQGTSTIRIFDMQGRELISKIASDQDNVNVNLQGLKKGFYIININGQNNKTFKFFKAE